MSDQPPILEYREPPRRKQNNNLEVISIALLALAVCVFTKSRVTNAFILAALGLAAGTDAALKSPKKPLPWLALGLNCTAASYFLIASMGLA